MNFSLKNKKIKPIRKSSKYSYFMYFSHLYDFSETSGIYLKNY